MDKWYDDEPSDDFKLVDEKVLKLLVKSYNHRLNSKTKEFLEWVLVEGKEIEGEKVSAGIIQFSPRVSFEI